MGRKKTRSLSVEENERWRGVARRIMEESYGGKQGPLAKALGVEQPTVSDFLSGKRGAGTRLLRGLERLASSSTMASALRRGLEDPYPSRRVVVELARGAGVDESVIFALLAVETADGRDVDEDFWHQKLLEIEARRTKLLGELAARKR